MVFTSVYDLLAALCALLPKETERRCAAGLRTANESYIRQLIGKHRTFINLIHNSLEAEYTFSINAYDAINEHFDKLKTSEPDEIFQLIITIENELMLPYSGWLANTVFHAVPPLNRNHAETGIKIYPRAFPMWNTSKSERNRELIINHHLKNYMIVRRESISPFELDMYYWNDTGLLQPIETGWVLSIALSPVMNYAKLQTEEDDSGKNRGVAVRGLKNEDIVTDRILDIFETLYSQQYGIIVFPECLGTEGLLRKIRAHMALHPEYCTLVVLPTICNGTENLLIVLGPGGVECLRHKKSVPFIHSDENDIERSECLKYDNHIPILITSELGMVAFPICAEFLDPMYYRAMVDDGLVDTIICPSFSPGSQAFVKTITKGTASGLLQLYINTCSGKSVSKKGQDVPEPIGIVQLPYTKETSPLYRLERSCGNNCSATICYFDISIAYDGKTFLVERHRFLCA